MFEGNVSSFTALPEEASLIDLFTRQERGLLGDDTRLNHPTSRLDRAFQCRKFMKESKSQTPVLG